MGENNINYHFFSQYTCDDGYELASGTLTMTCDASITDPGVWQGQMATCTRRQCSEISINGGSIVENGPYFYEDAITYVCDTGYNMTGKIALRLCYGNFLSKWLKIL